MYRRESGFALVLVLIVIATTASLTMYLGGSIYFSSRLHQSFLQRSKAEYLLKSTLNIAREIISQGKGSADPPKNSWGTLTNGIEVDGSLLGIRDRNVTVGLEITSLDSKLSLRKLYDHSKGEPGDAHDLFLRWRGVFTRLFKNLGFDNDNEIERSGLQKGVFFDSEALVANLIDYIDEDQVSYNGEDGFKTGIESSLPKETFPNRLVRSVDELENVPGFTSKRLRALEPFVTAEPVDQANINLISSTVLKSLAPELSDADVQNILAYAKGPDGPYDSFSYTDRLAPFFNDFNETSRLLTTKSVLLQVIAKIQYGSAKYFLRAILSKPGVGESTEDSELPEVIKIELFG